MATLLVTGGAGFIGSAYVLQAIDHGHTVINLDALTYSGTLSNLECVLENPKHIFVKGSINDTKLVSSLLEEYNIEGIINFAAESHVDRSIHGPEIFIQTNILGTFSLLEATRLYLDNNSSMQDIFRFIHISTDEVFGSLSLKDAPFTEKTAYDPSSPYSASKASSDHIVRSYVRTYNIPAMITNCSNNYGARQYPEKLIPLIFGNALEGKALPIYGKGENIRDWLYVEDHCRAIELVRTKGTIGETYCIGGSQERTTLQVVHAICAILDELRPKNASYTNQIHFVKDRAGHDFRYAINATKLSTTLGWKAEESFETGMKKTLIWYLDNTEWLENIRTSKDYTEWLGVMKR